MTDTTTVRVEIELSVGKLTKRIVVTCVAPTIAGAEGAATRSALEVLRSANQTTIPSTGFAAA